MPKRSSIDPNQSAYDIVQQATGQATPKAKPEKNPAAVALGRLGGLNLKTAVGSERSAVPVEEDSAAGLRI